MSIITSHPPGSVSIASKVNGKCHNVRVCQHWNPSIFKRFCTVDFYVEGPTHMQVLGSVGSKGACLRMREIVTLRRLFFSFLVLCTSLQIGPLDRSSPLTAQMTHPGSVHVLFMVSLKISLFFTPKCDKLHCTLWEALHPMGTLKSYNFGIVEDTYKLFAPNRGFSVRPI